LDRGCAGRNAALVLPAPREDEPVGRIELEILAERGVTGDDLAAINAARPRIEIGVHAFPADELVRVDEELPDRLRTGGDRDRPLDRGGLSGCVHASFAPPSPLRV